MADSNRIETNDETIRKTVDAILKLDPSTPNQTAVIRTALLEKKYQLEHAQTEAWLERNFNEIEAAYKNKKIKGAEYDKQLDALWKQYKARKSAIKTNHKNDKRAAIES